MTEIYSLPVGELQANCIVVSNGGECAIVDPGAASDAVLKYVSSKNLTVKHVLATHAHFDHVFGAGSVKKAFPNAPVVCHEADVPIWVAQPAFCRMFGMRVPTDLLEKPDATFADNAEFVIGNSKWVAIPTPGHTPGSVSFYNAEEKIVITGDTLFAAGVGRTDFPGGSSVQLKQSLQRLQKECAPTARLYCGHGGDALLKQALAYGMQMV